MITKFITAGMAVFTLTTGLAGPAQAQDGHSFSYELRLSKAELQTEAGLGRALQKVKATAQETCAEEFASARFVKDRMRFDRCVRWVTKDLIRKIDRPRLTALHRGEAPVFQLAQTEE